MIGETEWQFTLANGCHRKIVFHIICQILCSYLSIQPQEGPWKIRLKEGWKSHHFKSVPCKEQLMGPRLLIWGESWSTQDSAYSHVFSCLSNGKELECIYGSWGLDLDWKMKVILLRIKKQNRNVSKWKYLEKKMADSVWIHVHCSWPCSCKWPRQVEILLEEFRYELQERMKCSPFMIC